MSRLEKGKKPTKLQELILTDNSFSVYSADEAIKLGFAFGKTDGSRTRRVCVWNLIKYQEFQDDQNPDAKVWYGVGIRWIVDLKMSQGSADISAMPYIAAAADFRLVEASSRFQVIGLNHPTIDAIAAKSWHNFDVKSYGEMAAGFERVAELINDKATKVTPALVARIVIDNETEEEYANSVLQVWALQMISAGKSLSKAQESFPNATSADKAVIKNVYGFILNKGDIEGIPNQVAVARASELLHGLKVKK